MKKLYITLIFVIAIRLLFAQKENNNWYFGDSAGIAFYNEEARALSNGVLNTYEGSATISDTEGKLLFYTDGVSIWDNTHLKMPHGDSLLGNGSSTQSALIIPFPDNNLLYYVFTVEEYGARGKLSFSIVDMSLNNGKGDVTIKNNFIISSVHEKLTAVKHSNKQDLWLMVHGTNNNNFYCFLINSIGVSLNPVISTIGPRFSSSDAVGYMKFSPDASKIAFTSYYGNYVALFDFNPSTGSVNNEKYLFVPVIMNFSGPYGIEFSNRVNYLYASLLPNKLILQWDISSNNALIINSSLLQVGNSSAPLGALQLAPNGKIFVAEHNTSFLGVINYPDSSGPSCNYVDNAISLGQKTCQIGLPNFITSYFLRTGIESDNLIQNQMTIYPNPFKSDLNISIHLQNAKKISFTVRNILGQIVLYEEGYNSNNVYSKTIDLSFFHKGVYFIDYESGNNHIVKKLVKE